MPEQIERWEPFREMMTLRNRIDHLFESAFARPRGEGHLSPHHAGILAARLAHLERHATALIEAIEQEERLSPTAYPAIWEQITALRTALGTADTGETVPVRAAT
jgi:hypothetical protein